MSLFIQNRRSEATNQPKIRQAIFEYYKYCERTT